MHFAVFRTDLIPRWKDRTSRTSQLTNDESFSFQCALYRLWLYSAVYGMGEDNGEGDDDKDILDEEVDGGDTAAIQTVQARGHSFLDSFTSSHLDDMEKVYEFLMDTVTWVVNANWRERDITGSFPNGFTITISNYQFFSNRILGASGRPTGGS